MIKPKCPVIFTTDFGRELVKYLGGDASEVEDGDCWKDFGVQFPELVEPAMTYFEKATTGDPAYAAYCLVLDCHGDLERAMRVCETATTGDPALAAYCLVRDCDAPREWYEELKTKRGWK